MRACSYNRRMPVFDEKQDDERHKESMRERDAMWQTFGKRKDDH